MSLDRPGHHPVVKRLFKQAEENKDTELVAAFLVAFDRLIRRKRRMRYHYNYQTRESWQEEELFSPRDQIVAPYGNPNKKNVRAEERAWGVRIPRNGRLFSYRTRGYLRCRACRYFRHLGFQRPSEYCSAVSGALARYRDEDVAKGENILDNWSLMVLAFRRSPVLQFKRSRVALVEGRSLGELAAAPLFEPLWKQPAAAPILLDLLAQAHSRLVRVWAMQLLKQHHSLFLQSISADQLLFLLDHSDQELQHFAAGLLDTLTGVDLWPITTWLRLLESRSVTALATICETMSRRVSPERLSLQQCVALACVRATPVARLGLAWLSSRPVNTAQDREAIARLAEAKCEAVGVEIADYALAILCSPQSYNLNEVSRFFDSFNVPLRQQAWVWLTPSSPGYDDAGLWSRLLETPFDDVRIRLIAELNQRAGQTTVPSALRRQDLSAVWTTVLLGIHRGGRAKLTAMRQISQAISEHPDRAEQLLPVLAVAIRSVRPPEVRAGLAAILSAIAARPELEQLLARQIPELRLTTSEVAP